MKFFTAFLCGFLLTLSAFASGKRTITCLPLDQGLEDGCALLPDLVDECDQQFAPFFQESCLKNSTSLLIPEIVNADYPDHALVEKSFKPFSKSTFKSQNPFDVVADVSIFKAVDISVFLNHTPTEIAQSLVYRTYKIHDLPRIREILSQYPKSEWKNLTSLYDEVKVQIQFNSRIADKIVKNGFLNLFQTGQTNGLEQQDRRFRAETFYWGLNLNGFPDRLPNQILPVFPKYAYANPIFPSSGFVRNNAFMSFYGDVIAELGDDAMHLSTLTLSDSLTVIKEITKNKDGYHTFRMIKPKNTFLISDLVPGPYAEVQLLGPLETTKIESLLVNCFIGQFDKNSQRIAKISGSLLSSLMQVPAYECNLLERDRLGTQFHSASSPALNSEDTLDFKTSFKAEKGASAQ